jgi:hypothetical protein
MHAPASSHCTAALRVSVGVHTQLLAQGVLGSTAEAERMRTQYNEQLDGHTQRAKTYVPHATHLQGTRAGRPHTANKGKALILNHAHTRAHRQVGGPDRPPAASR